MNIIIKKAVKTISLYRKAGITLSALLKILHKEFDAQFNFKNDHFIEAIKNSKEISIVNGKGDPIDKNSPINEQSLLVTNKATQTLCLKQNLLNCYFKNDESTDEKSKDNEMIYLVYQEICKAGPDGISYTKLAENFNQKAKKTSSNKHKIET